MDPIVAFLKDDILPEAKSEAEKIRRNATRFWLFKDHKLYRRSYSGPYLLCVHPKASELLLEEIQRRDLRESHRRKIPLTPSPYLGLLVAGDAKGSSRVC